MITFSTRIIIDGSDLFGRPPGGGSIVVLGPNPNSAQFETQVNGLLRAIDNQVAGHGLLASINRCNHQVWIVPCSVPDEVASAPLSLGAIPSGARSRDFQGNPESDANGPIYGTGGGSDVLLRFHFQAGHALVRPPDAVLVHELVHAMRAMAGRLNNLPMPSGMSSQEEFLSILVENIYVASRGNFEMRIAHRPRIYVFEPPPRLLIRRYPSLSVKWASKYGMVLDRLWRQEPFLCWELITAGGYFNPVRDRRLMLAGPPRDAAAWQAVWQGRGPLLPSVRSPRGPAHP